MTFVDPCALSAALNFSRALSSNLSLLKMSDRIVHSLSYVLWELMKTLVGLLSFISEWSFYLFLVHLSISGIIPFHGFSMYGKYSRPTTLRQISVAKQRDDVFCDAVRLSNISASVTKNNFKCLLLTTCKLLSILFRCSFPAGFCVCESSWTLLSFSTNLYQVGLI